jgi:poly(3-hydroxybutyrate) depolymerase
VVKNPLPTSEEVEVFDTALGARTRVRLRPMSSTKVGVRLSPMAGAHTLATNTGAKLSVTVGEVKPGSAYKVTFRSAVDDSIQYYGVNPSTKPEEGQALFLSLHGASVEAIGQAQAYGPHDWGNLVAATNRRPFGFDWEEVGRLDALEVLAQGIKRFSPDSNRIYLTGHSMGGHGTWSVGSLFPDRFAAIMPSAGWISFSTYAGGATYRETDPVEKILKRADLVYDTLARKQNLFTPAVYVLHGDADDNVPVEQARRMVKELAGHPNLKWYEEKGAGHWWDKDPAPGADCVDWKPGFELFRSVERPDAALKVRFTTPDPWISPSCRWARIGEQTVPLMPSSIDLALEGQALSGATSNVSSLSISLRQLETVTLDDQRLTLYGVGPYGLEKVDGKWRVVPASEVRAVPHGAKAVFANHVCFIYGTGGTPDEQEATRELAQYWQENFQYRGNAGVEVLSDKEAERRGLAAGGGNVVLFGRPDTNALWSMLSSRFTVKLGRGAVSSGGRRATGDDLAYVGLADLGRGRLALGVGGTGATGLRLAARTPIFTSGAAYPDFLVWSPKMLESGSAGVVMAGFAGSPQPDLAWR